MSLRRSVGPDLCVCILGFVRERRSFDDGCLYARPHRNLFPYDLYEKKCLAEQQKTNAHTETRANFGYGANKPVMPVCCDRVAEPFTHRVRDPMAHGAIVRFHPSWFGWYWENETTQKNARAIFYIIAWVGTTSRIRLRMSTTLWFDHSGRTRRAMWNSCASQGVCECESSPCVCVSLCSSRVHNKCLSAGQIRQTHTRARRKILWLTFAQVGRLECTVELERS